MNKFGRLFSVTIFGESHGAGVGIVIDGVPPGIVLVPEDFREDMARRRSGAKGTTPRSEPDVPEIRSGVFKDKTTGAPLTILIENTNVRSGDYDRQIEMPRPGHADFVAMKKYKGFNDYRGGGHFSGRLTSALVAAGVIAKKILTGVEIKALLTEAGGSADIEAAVQKAVDEKDSIGGIVVCRVNGLPVGLGEPFFDSAESLLSHAVFSIPAIKGIEFGAGFAAAKMKGSEHNDLIVDETGKTATNHAGGINGGITNGNELVFRVVVKPTSSIGKIQHTLNVKTGKTEDLLIKGRHDACIALRVPPVLEAVTAITLADLWLVYNAYKINNRYET
ncbi:MAG: chorismate synthase [Bacteroidales bacterium]|nr:chorismate synthase [Bacteroidales bacterium]